MDNQLQHPATEANKLMSRATWHIAIIIGMAIILTIGGQYFILQPYKVDGISMEPTLSNEDRLAILRTGKIINDILGTDYIPKRGEIIVFNDPIADDNRKLIKRVVGLPNERLIIQNNKIIIYNEQYPRGFELDLQLDPALEDFPSQEPVIDRIINEGEVFVLGDNRLPSKSADSRGVLGNIPVDNIQGTVVVRVLPLGDFKIF